MFKKLKEIFSIKTLRNKLIFTLLMIAFIRLGNTIPTPGVRVDAVQSIFGQLGQSAGLLNAITGGGLQKMSLFALGIIPYINASIIIQLLTIAIAPLERLAKEDGGRDTINKITRWLGIALAALQAVGLTFTFRQSNIFLNQSFMTYLAAILALTAGTAILMWLGDRITEKGIGNGVSLIIFINILSSLPGNASEIWQAKSKSPATIIMIVAIIILTLGIVVYEQEAERRIQVEYAKRMAGRKMTGAAGSYIPIKLNISGVLPLIFAVSVVQFPQLIVTIFGLGGKWASLAHLLSFKHWFGTTLYVVLIFFFAYFYSTIQFNPLEFSENLKKSGGVVTGIRPGASTAEYIRKILSKTTFIGASFLTVIALVPIMVEAMFPGVDLAFAGTSLIIAVGVALEMLRQVEAHMISRNYQGFLK